MTALAIETPNNLSPAERFYSLFRGAEERHGTYDPSRLRLVGQKMEMKDENGNGPIDVKGPPTPALWAKHLSGSKPLGVSPLREDGLCRHGVIDIDIYDLDHAALARRIRDNCLPLVLTRSKSGGAHAWLFATDWLPQKVMNDALKSLAGRLGFSNADLFPPPNSPGNWVNAPFFSSEERPGIKHNGLEMTVPEFLAIAESARQSPEAISALARPRATGRSADVGGQEVRAAKHLDEFASEIANTLEGGRAKLLYGRAKDMGRMVGAGWIEEDIVLDALLDASLRAGLSPSEAIGHIRSGLKEGKKEPPDDRGDNGGRHPHIAKIVVLTGGEEKLWRVTVDGYGDITLPSKFVWRNDFFNQRCAEELRVAFRRMKDNDWADRLNAALEVAETEALPREETVEGVLFENLQAFCLDKHRADVIEEILWRKPYTDEDAGRVYFRFRDFHSFLRDGRDGVFKGMTMHSIGKLLRGIGREGVDLGKTTKNLKGKITELYWVRSDIFQGADAARQVPLPKIEKTPI